MYHKWQPYDVWFLTYGAWRTEFLLFWTNSCPFTHITTQKIKILKTAKKPGYIIILHKCTINDNHMMYGSWDMKHDKQNFLSFWTVFFPLYSPNNPKNQNFQKLKKSPGDIIILHKCTKNHNHMLCCSWDMVHNRCNYFSFWAIFCPFTSLTAQKLKI